MQNDFYESLLNRGWRRSGTLLYKPDQRASCCPLYTIRLDSESFHASKDQRQSLNRFNRFILGETYLKDAARLHPVSREQAKRRNTDFDLVDRVHEAESDKLKTPPEPAHTLSVTLEPNTFTEEKYALYENYQRVVHHNPPAKITKPGFKDFLCSSPLPLETKTFDGAERRLGAYHHCYRIDGQLVAMGVLDLLPHCVSSKYFMYHESVHCWGFGKLGALWEIALAREAGYHWWYAGFYIHSNPKMRTKAVYHPQYLLDSVSYTWDILDDDLKKRLDIDTFVSLSEVRAKSQNVEDGAATKPGSIETHNDADSEDFSKTSFDKTPMYARRAPGVLTKNQLLTDIDLDHIKLRIREQDVDTCQLMHWDKEDMNNPNSITGIISDLVAVVGVELGAQMTVEFN